MIAFFSFIPIQEKQKKVRPKTNAPQVSTASSSQARGALLRRASGRGCDGKDAPAVLVGRSDECDNNGQSQERQRKFKTSPCVAICFAHG